MLRDLEHKIAATARGVGRIFGMTVVACLLIFAGLAFLSVAGWIWLEDAIGALLATLILGVLNLVAGGVVFVVSRPAPNKAITDKKRTSPGPAPDVAPGAADANVPAMVQAFIAGFQAGRSPPTDDKPR